MHHAGRLAVVLTEATEKVEEARAKAEKAADDLHCSRSLILLRIRLVRKLTLTAGIEYAVWVNVCDVAMIETAEVSTEAGSVSATTCSIMTTSETTVDCCSPSGGACRSFLDDL